MAAVFTRRLTLTDFQRRPDYGMVWLCHGCQLPVGDTKDWSGNHAADNVVLLKAVSQFVQIGKRTLSSDPSDAGSLYQTLSCSNCYHVLGKFYSSTPAHLNYKMNLYNIDNSVVYRYTLGEYFQQVIHSSQAPITLELCQCYEEEIKKQKILLEMSLDRLSKLEKEVLPPPVQDF